MNYFEKILELQKSSPRIGMSSLNNVNSDYTSYCAANKNCYLLIGSEHDQDCMYGNWVYYSTDCVDCDFVFKCELCNECVDAENCYNCDFCQDCSTCSNSVHCYDCKSCKNCFGCVGLRNKEFHIFNEPFKKDEYFAKVLELKNANVDLSQADELKAKTPRMCAHVADNENCTGDYLYHSKNCFACFDGKKLEDCAHMTSSIGCRDCVDMANSYFGCELSYEVMSSIELYNCNFCNFCYNCRDLEYSEYCYNSRDCFGSFYLQHKQFYIFNKPFPKDTYFAEVAKIKRAMLDEGTYGKHLPATIPFSDSAVLNYFRVPQKELNVS